MQFWLDVFDPPTPLQKFHVCNLLCYTCVKWYFRSMQIWLGIVDPPPPKFYRCILSHYTTAIQPISIQPLQTQQKPRVTEAQHNAEKHSLFLFGGHTWSTWIRVSDTLRDKVMSKSVVSVALGIVTNFSAAKSETRTILHKNTFEENARFLCCFLSLWPSVFHPFLYLSKM